MQSDLDYHPSRSARCQGLAHPTISCNLITNLDRGGCVLRYGTVRTRRANDVAYALYGPADGGTRPPLLFVHPINLRKECWLDMVVPLAGDRLCLTVDLAGHGESSDDADFGLAGWTSDCVDVVTALDLQPFHLVGCSLGGAIALCVAADLPGSALSVTAMGAYLGESDAGADRALLDLVDRNTVDELFVILAAEAVAPGSPPELVTTVRHLTNRHGKPIVRRVLEAAGAADGSPWLPRVRCPVLVLTGEFDSSCSPSDGAKLAASVDGRHEILPGVGHLPMLEDAGGVLRMMAPYLG
ncbi:alpha/beta hydrolase [Micromonospora sp. WMMD1102]|uniref:alpha/beta fold hydrolase n=1 Tax=Micromonospora sp. WMMD1102 TaxID=3016105 RepID=UPI0024155BEE|nr:alpha/beta hydrolase [Micromonospora sp. WMMD1102]MDG4788072.1 alpha/beta hydrolase [Micromonospora sp. WMMD1102]